MSDAASPLPQPGAVATSCYATAVVLIPVGVACKFLFGLDGTIWIDPTLLLTVATALALVPTSGDFLRRPLSHLTLACAVLVCFSVLSALWGLALRGAATPYDLFREPIRLALVLCWMLVSAWFFLHKPLLALRCAAIAVVLALASGIYLYLGAFDLPLFPASVRLYIRLYLLRQSVWFAGYPIPRMGGLFVEAPPFGLFMASMLAVLAAAFAAGFRARWLNSTALLVLLGVVLSLATQVWLGVAVALLISLPVILRHRPVLLSVIGGGLLVLLVLIGWAVLRERDRNHDALPTTNINGNSLGEREFHIRYGIDLLTQQPAAAIFGIGPGRYGEYAADTGLFPSSVTMQSSAPELLVEWGGAGLACWLAIIGAFGLGIWHVRGLAGLGCFAGLILADSFQANWKAEAVAFALAAMYILPAQHFSAPGPAAIEKSSAVLG